MAVIATIEQPYCYHSNRQTTFWLS